MGAGAGARGGAGAGAVAILGTGMGPVFIDLLPVKLGMGKSLGGAFGFCCTHVTTVGIKLVKAATISCLQAATTSRIAFSFLHRPRHLLVDSHLTELLSLSFGLGVLVIIVLPRGPIRGAVHTSILRPLAGRVSHHYVHGPVERSVPLVLHRRLSRLSRRVSLGRKLVLLSLQNGP